jgi:hypothetical protein
MSKEQVDRLNPNDARCKTERMMEDDMICPYLSELESRLPIRQMLSQTDHLTAFGMQHVDDCRIIVA